MHLYDKDHLKKCTIYSKNNSKVKVETIKLKVGTTFDKKYGKPWGSIHIPLAYLKKNEVYEFIKNLNKLKTFLKNLKWHYRSRSSQIITW